jgi:phosphatidylglycerol---prolipoprotein diacylglyceryl transferase
MFTNNLDPILFDFGLIAVRWYSLAYIVGILLGWWFGKKIIIKRFKNINQKFNLKEFDDLITYLIISIIIGGRVGYIIFYNFDYYISNPLEIIKIWEGGMSFHGALLGVIIGTKLFSTKRNIIFFFYLDIIACVSPIGIFFGRIANFINGELMGKVTNVTWSVIFPNIDMLPRHPSQLYEAFLEGIVLFFILNTIVIKKYYKIGTCSYLFLICYGVFRIISEFFREPDAQIGYLFDLFSMGTLLSFAMIIGGIALYAFIKKNEIKF